MGERRRSLDSRARLSYTGYANGRPLALGFAMTLPLSSAANGPHLTVPAGAAASFPAATLRDLVALTKPRITTTVLMTTMGGLFMAPVTPPLTSVAGVALGTAMVVGGANALNMYLERDSDRHMTRTAKRPLPSRRMAPATALLVGLALSGLALPVIYASSNIMTALLAAIANVSYVMVYTPMKQRSWTAVLVGAVPGAIPPLLGWTAATGLLGAGGLALFGILFAWQIPHFHAIALFREEEYTRAGLKVMPRERGQSATRRSIALWTAALVAASFTPFWLGLTNIHYVPCALVLGLVFFCSALYGVFTPGGTRWAKGYFALSIPYLVLIFAALLSFRAFLAPAATAARDAEPPGRPPQRTVSEKKRGEARARAPPVARARRRGPPRSCRSNRVLSSLRPSRAPKPRSSPRNTRPRGTAGDRPGARDRRPRTARCRTSSGRSR